MTDQPTAEAAAAEPAAAPAQALAVRPTREVRVTTSERAIWDTAAFEHFGRVAVIMADTGVMPESFRGERKGEGNNSTLEPFERPQVIANALMLCSMAREMDANPFLFMQCASLVRGRIMLEGKVIAAAIEHRAGVRLKYVMGLWDTDHFVAVATPEELHGAGERLAVRVVGRFADEDFDRVVEGSVGQWTTGAKGAWAKIADWPRQLRYRGAREWGRAHAPGVTLGIYGDGDEFEEEQVQERQPRQKRDLAAKLGNGKAGESPQEPGDGAQGFDRAGVAEALGDTVQGGQGGDAVDAEFSDACAHEFEGEGEDRACRLCGVLEDDTAERPTTAAGATGTDGVQTAGAEPASSGSAEDASEGSAEGEVIEEGHAARGDAYLFAGDAFIKDRRLTYKDGVRFSTAGPQGAAKLKVYAIHAPEVAAEPEPEAEPQPEAQAEGAAAPEAEAEAEAGGDESFLGRMRRETSWAAIKPILLELNKSTDFVAASDQEKDEVRAAVWAEVERVKADHDDKVNHATDISAFSLWLATQGNSREDADAVEGTFAVLANQEVWGKVSGATQDVLRQRVDAKLRSIRGKS